MTRKNRYNKERDGLQQGIYAIINPFVRLLIRMGVTPNMVTTIGLLGNIAAAALIARAEGVGLECKVGFMQRPERVVVTAVGCLACGITGMALPTSPNTAITILIVAMAIIAVFANITAFARVDVCRRGLK